MKKKKTKSKKSDRPSKAESFHKKDYPDEQTEENLLTYGGLPDRNLKKNLGCG